MFFFEKNIVLKRRHLPTKRRHFPTQRRFLPTWNFWPWFLSMMLIPITETTFLGWNDLFSAKRLEIPSFQTTTEIMHTWSRRYRCYNKPDLSNWNRSSWWLNQPIWKNMLVKLGSSSPNFGVQNSKKSLSCHHPGVNFIHQIQASQPTEWKIQLWTIWNHQPAFVPLKIHAPWKQSQCQRDPASAWTQGSPWRMGPHGGRQPVDLRYRSINAWIFWWYCC